MIDVVAPQERALALRLLGYPTALANAVDTYSPHKLCNYIYELATKEPYSFLFCDLRKNKFYIKFDSEVVVEEQISSLQYIPP